MKKPLPTEERILSIMKHNNGVFEVHRYSYRQERIRRHLKKLTKKVDSKIKFLGCHQNNLLFGE